MNQKLIFRYDKNKFWILRSKIEHTAGFNLNNKKDCQKLSLLIHEKTNCYISVSTIYRFFLNNKLEQSPYLHTLNIFSRFCGFSSWPEFNHEIISNFNNLKEKSSFTDDTDQNKSLIKCCLITNAHDSLILFLNCNQQGFSEEEYIIYGREIFDAISSKSYNNPENIKTIFSNSCIQLCVSKYILSHSIIPPTIESGMLIISDLCEQENFEFYLFMNLILLKHYVETNQDFLIRKCLIDLYNKNTLKKIEKSKINSLIFDRYLCGYLIHLKFNNINQTKKIEILVNKLNFNFSDNLIYLLNETSRLISFNTKPLSLNKINKKVEARSTFDEECLRKQCELTGNPFTNMISCTTKKMKFIELIEFKNWYFERSKFLFNYDDQEISKRCTSYLAAYDNDYFSELSEIKQKKHL